MAVSGLLACRLGAAPAPGIGLLLKADAVAALRGKIRREPWAGIYAKIKAAADRAVKDWPQQRDTIAPHLGKLLDLSVGHAPAPSHGHPRTHTAAAHDAVAG